VLTNFVLLAKRHEKLTTIKEGSLEAGYLCGHYTLLAHGKVAKWYHNDFKGTGRITFKNYGSYYEPTSNSSESSVAVQRLYDFEIGW
jgi:WD repeat-containing protein 26